MIYMICIQVIYDIGPILTISVIRVLIAMIVKVIIISSQQGF